MPSKSWSPTRVAFSLVVFACRCVSTVTEPAPIVVPPSQYWEGNDGPWSTFSLRVGTPSDQPSNLTRALVSTAIPNTWVVMKQACSTLDCANARGGDPLFYPNTSTTWKDVGIYNLAFESNLNYTGNGQYGIDTVGLGIDSSSGPTLTGQIVAGIVTTDFYLGNFGVNPQPTNFSNFEDPKPSFFQTLKDQNMIPSLSYSYTAGNQYQLKQVYGSLVFGGYDSSRFKPNNVYFNFASDVNRDLVVALQSVYSTEESGKTTNLLSGGILTYVDSTVPYIILPSSACEEFENAYGLEYDGVSGLYLVSDSVHTSLQSRNVNFTFVLSNTISGGSTVTITLPYAAFDLTVSSPHVNSSSKYFPLKRGNDTTYTLGRTFLQEAYLTADYERKNFSISQCIWNEDAQEDIGVIHSLNYRAPPSADNSTSGGNGSSDSGAHSLTVGAIVGIVVAAVVIILIIVALAVTRHFRKWPFHKRPLPGSTELDSTQIGHEADSRAFGKPRPDLPEADSKSDFYGPELVGSEGQNKVELAGSEGRRSKNELPGAAVHRPDDHRELMGSNAANEVEGSHPNIYMELAGSPVPLEYYGNSRAAAPVPSRPASSRHDGTLSPRSPLSQGAPSASPMLTPRSARGSGLASPLSEAQSSRGLRNSPVSAGSHSRDPSRSRRRDRSGEGARQPSISPGGIGDGGLRGAHEDVSREVSRTRGTSGHGYFG